MPTAAAPAAGAQPPAPGRPVRTDWFQTAERVCLSLFVKNRGAGDVEATATDRVLRVAVQLQGGEEWGREWRLHGAVRGGELRVDVRPVKVELQLPKAQPGVLWPSLEAAAAEDGSPPAPQRAACAAPPAAPQGKGPRAAPPAPDSDPEDGPAPAPPAAGGADPAALFFGAMYQLADARTRGAMMALQGAPAGRTQPRGEFGDVEAVIALVQQLLAGKLGRDTGGVGGGEGPLLAAHRALRGGDYARAAAAVLRLLEDPPPDAAHAHARGVARLARGDFTGARAAWLVGAEQFPSDATLRDEAAAAAAYSPRRPSSLPRPPSLGDLVALRPAGASHGDTVWQSKEPLLTAAECSSLIAAAEAAAAAQGGWQRKRQMHPTRDMPIRNAPAVLAVWRRLLDDWIAPALHAAFPEALPDPLALRVFDSFAAVFDSAKGGQRGLERHRDQAELTCVVHLSDPGAYGGGGTQFDVLGEEPVRPPQGHATLFRGLYHCGVPVTAGARYILTGFLYAEQGAC
eukprot:TRINITY_DN26871_c0_g1_i1.p2 TRINITY_DN26871_c0_g1~~TRINITY_DN26871_c0_g1_i1.p2  ORF type:complete len:540 (+),score=141.99 TRINITY_DN26871_c0_g1_i1:77-1621(+)